MHGMSHKCASPGFISAAESVKFRDEEQKIDCCKWRGVGCNNRTGHITLLDLHGLAVGGNITDSLLELQHLNYLDLSDNNFHGSPFPSFVGSLSLSSTGLIGSLSYQLGNHSSLQSLDLSSNNYDASFESLSFINSSRSLAAIDLSNNHLPLQYSPGCPTSAIALLILAYHSTSYRVRFQMPSEK
ncbi:LRR RECEPTOR-LIKE KINASE [Salix viminalis]|uniref:LRR RECEPTOR-LIKE KINASE n=1 Tax=Salix viminalis TaxID=40686 RepID=A0A9Q0NWL6_SALVM|nr:LRR RECEPTOR-LIKE KINASE [Salix viminalis]